MAIATGESHSVRELVEVAFGHVGLEWQPYVKLDPKFLRQAEVDHLIGDSSKARRALGWTPERDFAGLVRMMVDADLARLAHAPSTPAGVESWEPDARGRAARAHRHGRRDGRLRVFPVEVVGMSLPR